MTMVGDDVLAFSWGARFFVNLSRHFAKLASLNFRHIFFPPSTHFHVAVAEYRSHSYSLERGASMEPQQQYYDVHDANAMLPKVSCNSLQ